MAASVNAGYTNDRAEFEEDICNKICSVYHYATHCKKIEVLNILKTIDCVGVVL